MSRRKHTAKFKSQVALAALKGDKTVSEIASDFGVNPSQVHLWKSDVANNIDSLFANSSKADKSAEASILDLERKVGQLTMDNDFLKKSYQSYQSRRGKK